MDSKKTCMYGENQPLLAEKLLDIEPIMEVECCQRGGETKLRALCCVISKKKGGSMFNFLKNMFQKNQEEKMDRQYPEAAFVVVVSEDEIVNNRPEGTVERVMFKDLMAVIIETNDSGPLNSDLWWILVGNGLESGCVFPGGATGEEDVLEVVQNLPGFDNEMFIKAMSSTDNQTFLCWRNVSNDKKGDDAR